MTGQSRYGAKSWINTVTDGIGMPLASMIIVSGAPRWPSKKAMWMFLRDCVIVIGPPASLLRGALSMSLDRALVLQYCDRTIAYQFLICRDCGLASITQPYSNLQKCSDLGYLPDDSNLVWENHERSGNSVNDRNCRIKKMYQSRSSLDERRKSHSDDVSLKLRAWFLITDFSGHRENLTLLFNTSLLTSKV